MRSKLICLLLLLAVVRTTMAQKTVVSPVPQNIIFSDGITVLSAESQIVGIENADPYAVKALQDLLQTCKGEKNKVVVCIGERGDKSVRKYARFIPQKADGYYLSVTDERIVLAGNDARGTFYAVQTLRQLLEDSQVKHVEIKDFPVIRFRGVVEGFYGTPWSHEARLRQLKFYGQNKMNTYIYGPKDDPYHRTPHWREPYPEKEAKQISELAKVAKENAVDFVWAIHPGQDIKWNALDRDLLLAKFEKMYRLGVRSFAVFFDDISGEGTDPVRQAELLNYIDDHFVKAKGDVTPLIMCPTIYNKNWEKSLPAYLPTLGEKLNASIEIMWTGDFVISDITKEGVDWVNERIKRQAYIWWNFPVSDYVRDHLLMGRVYGLDSDAGTQVSGFMSNPMEHAEASKVALYSIADYAWNPEQFNSTLSWKRSLAALLPEDYDALQVFANHNSDLGNNVHEYRREESVEIAGVADRFLADYKKGNYNQDDYDVLLDEYARIVEAADRLSENTENKYLIDEIRPWLNHFKLVGESGIEVLVMAKAVLDKNESLFMRKYRHLRVLQKKFFQINQIYNQNRYQAGIKSASKVMQPFADSLYILATNSFNQITGSNLDASIFTSPHKSYSSLEQCRNLQVIVKNNRVMISPMLEVIRWETGKYLGIELAEPQQFKGVEADFGLTETVDWLSLEISVDGVNWKEIELGGDGKNLKADLSGNVVKYLKITNKGKEEREIYLRKLIMF